MATPTRAPRPPAGSSAQGGQLDHDEVPDAELVHRARAGHAAATSLLLARHRTALLALCRRLVADPALAEDCVQDAALLAVLNLPRLASPDRFGAWLCGIGRHVCRRALQAAAVEQRHRAAAPAVEQPLASLPSPELAVEEVLSFTERSRAVRAAVADLPPGQREAVRLFYLSGLSYEDTAGALRIPIGALKGRLHKARLALRRRLSLHVDAPWERAAAIAQLRPRTQATHEAGHAVLHYLAGSGVIRIGIDLADARRGTTPRRPLQPGDLPRLPAYELLTVTMAGEAAELHAQRSRLYQPNRGDRPLAARLAQWLTGGDRIESALVVEQARRAAYDRLAQDRTWRLVERVAAALVERTVLDGDAFLRLVRS